MRFSYNEDGIEKLRAFTSARWPNELGQSHGVEHWDRVAKFGQMLYVKGADMNVIQAFAYLHDSERIDNDDDFDHGPRAAKLVDMIRHSHLSFLNDEQIAKLKRACQLHTVELRTGDMTIDICFDADRMDLLRVGITPLPDRMATQQGAEMVAKPTFADFYYDLMGW